MKDFWWQQKPWQAFKNFALLFSFVINLILLVVLLLALPRILPLVNEVAKPIVGGLNQSFVEMNSASITRTIVVSDIIPIDFNLPLRTHTAVTLTENVVLGDYPITMVLPGGGGQINGNVTLVLPAGLPLPVALNLNVPVRNQIPVKLNVAVNIPLNETELGAPFTRLQNLFGPLVEQLDKVPADNEALLESILLPE